MGNLVISIKRFLGNKNTVTIIGVLLGVVVLYFGYNWRVKQAVQPITVPVALQRIPGNTEIDSKMIGTIKVSKSFVDNTPELVTNRSQLINSNGTAKYVSYDTFVPEGGLFYKSAIKDEKEMPNYATKNLPKCYTLFHLSVDLHSTYGNAIMPGDYIDLFVSATSDDNRAILAKFIESIRVLDVRDSSGRSVFSSGSENATPAELLFGVSDNMFELLTLATRINSNNFKVFPVPRNAEYTENPTQTFVAGTEIRDLIYSKADRSYSNFQIDSECLAENQ